MLAKALRLYRVSLLRCLPLALLGALLAVRAGAHATAQAHALASHISDLMNEVAANPDSALTQLSAVAAALLSFLHSRAVWASYLGAQLIELVFQGALILRQAPLIDQPFTGAQDSSRRWLAHTLRRLPSLLLVVTLFALAATCAIVLFAAASGHTSLALIVGLVLVIAATWLWGQWQLWLVAMFTHQLSAVSALRASWNLVSGHWWRVSTLMSVPYIAVAVVSSFGEMLAAGSGGTSGSPTLTLSGQAVMLAIGTLTLPVLPAAWLAMYRELSMRRAVATGNPAGVDGPQV